MGLTRRQLLAAAGAGAWRAAAQVKAGGVITRDVATEALTMLEIDSKGFDKMDRRILLTIIDKFGGGPVGVVTKLDLLEYLGHHPRLAG